MLIISQNKIYPYFVFLKIKYIPILRNVPAVCPMFQ